MDDFSSYAMAVIEWALVPLILVGLLYRGLSLSPADPSLRTSTTAGKLAGSILFVLFVMSQKGHPLSVSFKLPHYGIELVPLVCSTVGFFLAARALNWILSTRLAGIVALLLVSASLTTLYAYVFLASYRSMIVYVALGGTLGVLLEMLLFARDRVFKKAVSE